MPACKIRWKQGVFIFKGKKRHTTRTEREEHLVHVRLVGAHQVAKEERAVEGEPALHALLLREELLAGLFFNFLSNENTQKAVPTQ